uniref:Fe2OG dioxygenase domain-containing protein n=1 Tax=Vannella robusta TaxID=1487602 RepID=A0A7S4HQ56_9EUKA|mmetsp:Transcript_14072/g.17742  ORF Transcript_14072/g.17742 Transcript_14072/m.17742 type:complete len:229 (+) Transcript_14072:547-1233(+)
MDITNLDRIVDPVVEVGSNIQCIEATEEVYSNYHPNGFISSSIMDSFHYFNLFEPTDKGKKEDKPFINNHGSHTDSGLMTMVVCTDEPGLEVLDQKTDEWIAIEDLLHQYVNERGENHREYATIFWGDSSAYLVPANKTKPVTPLFHRVGQCNRERYSVVFKQRTSVTTTPPRYQEDYLLAQKQLDSLEKSGIIHLGAAQAQNSEPYFRFFLHAAVLVVVVVLLGCLY